MRYRLKMAMGGMLEAPWSKVRQLEVTRQHGVMSMGGVGSFKVGVKAPAGSTPLEIATAGEAGAAASAIPHPQPAGAAPMTVAESTVSGVPVGYKAKEIKPIRGYTFDHTASEVRIIEGGNNIPTINQRYTLFRTCLRSNAR